MGVILVGFFCALVGSYFGYRAGKKSGRTLTIGDEIYYKEVIRAREILSKTLGWEEDRGYTVDTLAQWVASRLKKDSS
jgi:hypothetical protein